MPINGKSRQWFHDSERAPGSGGAFFSGLGQRVVIEGIWVEAQGGWACCLHTNLLLVGVSWTYSVHEAWMGRGRILDAQ